MSELEKILNEIKNYPTIMWIKDEVYFIEKLQTLTHDEISSDKQLFDEIIKELNTSHCGGGIFEITKDNLHIFEKFSNWLIKISSELNENRYKIEAENFRATFE